MEWAEIVADSWKSHLSHIWCQAQRYIAQQAQSHWAEVWRMSSTTRAGLLRSADTCQERCQNCNFWRSHCDTPSAQAVCLHQIITKSSLLFKTKCVIIQNSRLKMLQSLAIPKKLYLPRSIYSAFKVTCTCWLIYLTHNFNQNTRCFPIPLLHKQQQQDGADSSAVAESHIWDWGYPQLNRETAVMHIPSLAAACQYSRVQNQSETWHL